MHLTDLQAQSFFDNELTPLEAENVRMHLTCCGRCVKKIESLAQIQNATSALFRDEAIVPSPQSVDRIHSTAARMIQKRYEERLTHQRCSRTVVAEAAWAFLAGSPGLALQWVRFFLQTFARGLAFQPSYQIAMLLILISSIVLIRGVTHSYPTLIRVSEDGEEIPFSNAYDKLKQAEQIAYEREVQNAKQSTAGIGASSSDGSGSDAGSLPR